MNLISAKKHEETTMHIILQKLWGKLCQQECTNKYLRITELHDNAQYATKISSDS